MDRSNQKLKLIKDILLTEFNITSKGKILNFDCRFCHKLLFINFDTLAMWCSDCGQEYRFKSYRHRLPTPELIDRFKKFHNIKEVKK